MSFDITGKLIAKYDTEKKTEKFSVRNFVIEINETQYPEFVKFQMTNDRCAFIDPYNVGDTIKVHFDLRGREWQGKYFTNLNAWKIEAPTQAAPAAPMAQNDTPVFNDGGFPTAEDAPAAPQQNVEDLPF